MEKLAGVFCPSELRHDSILACRLQVSPAVKAVLAHPGHPYLNLFAQGKADGTAENIIITLVADWWALQTPCSPTFKTGLHALAHACACVLLESLCLPTKTSASAVAELPQY